MDPTTATDFYEDAPESKRTNRLNARRLLAFIAIAVVIGVFWQSPILKPLRLFVVFLHEISHALIAVATGGQVVDIQVFFSEGGVARSVGGSRFWTLMAGYLGSLLWGGFILIVASRTRFSRLLAVAIGVGLGLMTIFYVRNGAGFGFGLTAATAMTAGGLLLRESVVKWALRVVGLTSCLYAIYDIASDVILRPEVNSDARMLATHTGFPPFLSTTYQTLFWGFLWMGVSIAATVGVLRISSRKSQDGAE